MRWRVRHLKHKELYEWYQQQHEPKCQRAKFASRVKKYGYSKEKALTLESLYAAKRREYIVYDSDGRVCTRCWEYKKRDLFSYSKSGFNKHTPMCKECRNKYHNEHRQKTWYKADREYKDKKRHLQIGDQIYFNSEIWEVQSYSSNKWYIVKSIVTWEERRISTMDNHYRKNNHCVRFRKLLEKVTLVQPNKIKEVIEEKKYSIDLDEMLYWEYE